MPSVASAMAQPMEEKAILATAVIPWTERFEFDEDAFRRQVGKIAEGLTRHIYVFGTAGEGYAVTDAQFQQIASVFWPCALENQVQPMLGVISLSLGTVIERIAFGRSLGFREFQISLPSWGALTDQELDCFFRETCGRFPDCQFLHYNLARAGRVLGAEQYARLSQVHANFLAVKTGIQDPKKVRELMSLTPRLRFFFTEFGYAIARTVGDCGLLVSLSSIVDTRAMEYVQCEHARREELSLELRAILTALQRVNAGHFHMDGAYDKLLYRMKVPDFPLRLLPPYASASEKDAADFRAALPKGWQSA
jgi:dihydrodipicolinate synthase/N-acetylneuraminate lyase